MTGAEVEKNESTSKEVGKKDEHVEEGSKGKKRSIAETNDTNESKEVTAENNGSDAIKDNGDSTKETEKPEEKKTDADEPATKKRLTEEAKPPTTTPSIPAPIFGGFSTPTFTFSKTASSSWATTSTPKFDFNFTGETSYKLPEWNFKAETKGASAFEEEQEEKTKSSGSIEKPPTGEENESRIFSIKAKLYVWVGKEKRWKEKGEGKVHVNVSTENNQARLVMRMEAAYKLILNAAIFSQMTCSKPSVKTVQITAIGGVQDDKDEYEKLSTYMFKLSRKDEADDLFEQIQKQIGSATKSAPTESKETSKAAKPDENEEVSKA